MTLKGLERRILLLIRIFCHLFGEKRVLEDLKKDWN